MRIRRSVVIGFAVFGYALGASMIQSSVAAQERGERQIWDGVFTSAQAARGKLGFETSCGRCHNNELKGSERGPALSGDAFWSHWDNDTLDTLFNKIRDTMPAGGIDTVSDDSKLDILTYILSANGAKAGTAELTSEPAALQAVAIVKPGGVRGVSNFNLADVVGCLSRGDGGWVLTRATEPVFSREETPSPGAAEKAGSQPLGSLQFRLVSVVPAYNADALAGHKVDARGLIYRSASDNLLNLTGLQTTGTSCP